MKVRFGRFTVEVMMGVERNKSGGSWREFHNIMSTLLYNCDTSVDKLSVRQMYISI
jgi:hypothetical protein